MTANIDRLDRFHCSVCGQAWAVPSLALFCATKHDMPHEVDRD